MLKRVVPSALLMIALTAAVACAEPFVVPRAKRAPTIDGRIDPAEWAAGAGFDGFARDGRLQQRRAQGWIAATADTLYVAIRSRLPDEGRLAANVDRDSSKVVFDDAVEVFVNPVPESANQVCYQFLANAIGRSAYGIHVKGAAKEDVAWQGDWKHASGTGGGAWDFECAIPVASMPAAGTGRKTTDGTWKINLTRDWKSPWEWSSLSGEGGAYAFSGDVFRFTAAAPAVAQRFSSDPFVPAFEGVLRLHNPSAKPLELAASLVLTRSDMPTLTQGATVSLAPGEVRNVTLAVPRDDPATHYELRTRVASADGATVFHDRTIAWPRGRPYTWIAGKKQTARPIDFGFACYPYTNRLRIVADINGLPQGARLERLRAVVRNAITKEEATSVDFVPDGFADGKQELRLRLPPLDGAYEIALKAEGEKCPDDEVVRRFERKRFPWEHTPTGRSTKVYPPFTPIEMDEEKRTLKTVLRKHTLTDLGLLAQVEATSAHTGVTKPILAAPMRLAGTIEGKRITLARGDKPIVEIEPHAVQMGTPYRAGPLAGQVAAFWDYDGCVKVVLGFAAGGEKAVEELVLEIPFRADAATMIHANADRIRAPVAQEIPEGEGVVWDSRKVACDDYLKNFCPYVYIGDAVRGLAWFAENDLGWSWDRETPNLTVSREGDRVILRVHLINKPIMPAEGRRITFGLLAAPVKPRLVPPDAGKHGWRYRYLRDDYTLLGTDINWFGIGCGSVYPVGKDLYLWEMLAKGNREKLPNDEVKRVEDWGKQYFAESDTRSIESWVRHVRHNLRSRYGKKMVFYYNRASIQAAEEFETFKDEWGLTDLRSVGKGKGTWEIKIVPSPSYIDHALYWYARSFEVGGNQGVYWDNFFIAPTFNTEMSDAYKDADGRIVPAAGIWALRDLAKRTFILMNERGMRPITFPHMTSFSPLPMLSFCTVQYDWEWKYSEGDVQDRHTRDLILLTSTGDLAGTWPVPLGDHGKLANDPWTQRTFTAVRLVHELDGSGGFGSPWQNSHNANAKLAEPILALLDEPDLRVYRYWDERSQPVAADHPDVPTIVYVVPGKRAVAAVVSYAQKDETVALNVDAKAMGFDGPIRATNVETGEAMLLEGGKVRLTLKQHDVRVLTFEPGAVR